MSRTSAPFSVLDVEQAASRIAGHVHRTPLVTSRLLDRELGCQVIAKAEHLQRVGAFKARGAFNALLALDPARRAAGVLAVSSGNHGQAVALAAAETGGRAVVVMPAGSNPAKVAATRAYGAEVVSVGVTGENRETFAADLAAERGLHLVHPFDDHDVMAGQGTAALELLEEVADLDLVLVPVGGGGLIAGTAAAVKSRSPRIRVVGVEPAAAADAQASLRAGRRIPLPAAPATIADGVRSLCVGERPFAVIQALVDDIVTVTDADLLDALALCWSRTKQLIEPTAALGLAALRTGAAGGRRVGVVLTGGNVDAAALAACLVPVPSGGAAPAPRPGGNVVIAHPGGEEASMPTATRIRDHCLAPGRAVEEPAGGDYRRLFPELEALDCEDDALHGLGRVGGVCDAAAAAVQVGTDAANPDAEGAAGWPVFGQFVAHDITADRSPLTHHAELAEVRNARSPRANLEPVYGDGPAGMPFLYDRDDPAKLLVGRNDAGRPADLPRNPQGVALIADPRNDTHLLMSQLHVAMLHVHNGLVDRLRGDGVAEAELFAEARRAASWHYQWVLLEDFLPRVVGADLAGELLAGGARSYRPDPGEAWIPLEFADAAYRFGHSQIRDRYQVNRDAEPVPLLPDLLGFRPVPAVLTVDWSFLFDLPGRPPAQRAKRIDGRLAGSLIQLPRAMTGVDGGDDYGSLAVRDLQRGQGVGLPSGEAVARRLGVEPLSPTEVGLGAVGWWQETPLWFYLLKEAEHRGGGERLGPVGGRLVGEVLVGIVDADGESYRAVDPGWRPTLPAAQAGRFGLADLLVFGAEVAGAAA